MKSSISEWINRQSPKVQLELVELNINCMYFLTEENQTDDMCKFANRFSSYKSLIKNKQSNCCLL